MTFKELSQAARIEACACDHKVADACDIEWLLAFLFEFELSLVSDVFLDRFSGHGSALLLYHAQLDTVWVSEEAADEIGSEEDDAFA